MRNPALARPRIAAWAPGPGVRALEPPGARTRMWMAVTPFSRAVVAAALAAFGDGAMSNSIADFALADVLFVIGSNTTECHHII